MEAVAYQVHQLQDLLEELGFDHNEAAKVMEESARYWARREGRIGQSDAFTHPEAALSYLVDEFIPAK